MKPKLNVLHVTSWYPTKGRPFSGTFIRDHIHAVSPFVNGTVLHLAGANSQLSSRWACAIDSDMSSNGLTTYRVFYRPSRIPTVSSLLYLGGILKAWRQIKSMKLKPDLIHAHSYKGGAVAAAISKWARLPLVVSEHSAGFVQKTLAGKKLLQARLAFNTADLILPVSSSLKSGISHYISNAQFRIIPNVVGEEFFHEAAKSPFLDQSKIVQMLFVGQLRQDHIKGLSFLLEALARLAKLQGNPSMVGDWHLKIVGDGPSKAGYESLANSLSLGKRVTFLGRLPREKVARLMSESHFLVVSSLFETFSVVAAEGLAVGLPVLATRCGGPEDFIDDEVGALVEPGNVEDLAKGLSHLLKNWHKFSRKANSLYARNLFSSEKVGAQLYDVYAEVISRNR